MISPYIVIMVLAFLSGMTTLIGVVLALYFKKSARAIAIGIGFSVGIMMLIAFMELIPQSMSFIGKTHTLLALSLGAIVLAVTNVVIPHTHLVKEEGEVEGCIMKAACMITIGLILHDFPEGFAMAGAYLASPKLGLMIAIAIAIHNIPEEFAMAIPIASMKKRRLLFKLAFLSGLAEPAGALIGLIATHFFSALNPYFLSFAAGAMIFVSLHELLPMARRYGKISMFIIGIVMSLIVYTSMAIFLPG